MLGVDPYLGVGSISDSLSLLMIITRDEKRELLRTRDRVAAEVFEVPHLVLREVPALVSYRREILVDGSRGFLLFVEAANIYFISFFWDSCPPTHISIPGYLRHSVISRDRRFAPRSPSRGKLWTGRPFSRQILSERSAAASSPSASIVTINNITYLEGRGFLPHHPLHQQV